MKTLLSLILLAGVLAGGAVYYLKFVAADPPPNLREASVKQGELIATFGATGTIEPEEVVDVGAQVAGRIIEFGKDPSDPSGKKLIDYGATIHEGTILALIDDSVYKAQLKQTQASLLKAKADLLQAQAKLLQADRDRKRAEQLLAANTRLQKTDETLRVISDSDYDLAVANQASAAASVEASQSAVKLAEAALEIATTNLSYTVIKSPVEGVIIDRRVNIGQTVVASLSAPSLFLIAKDLRRMQVWASVNEADIGQVSIGMPVRFTVDAFRDLTFRGEVAQIRLNATMSQNVVSYTVVVVFDNSELKLKPYMTANLQFEVERRSNVLTVPNLALRWKPRTQLISAEWRPATTSAGRRSEGSGGGARRSREEKGDKGSKGAPDAEKQGRLWVRDGNTVRPIQVQIGMSDGTQTEVRGPELGDGLAVIVGENRGDAANAEETTNPFAPKLPFGRSGQRGSR